MKYSKDITSILPIDHKLSITYSKNSIIISNFSNIYDLKNNLIIIDNYKIVGDFMKVTTIENRCIKIEGSIKEIKIL